jgi:hypothetical protein
MSQPDVLYQWFKEIESQMDCLSKPQAFCWLASAWGWRKPSNAPSIG